jgi:DNA-binding IclR family transcriptional regulator
VTVAADERWSGEFDGIARAGAGEDRKFVTALARGLEVLRAFTPNEGLLGNQEIATRTGLPKATVSRLTYTLTRLGYLSRLDRLEKYQLAPGALSIGYATLANMRICQVARPHMEALANQTGASVALGTRDRVSAIYVEFCRGRSSIMTRLGMGSRIPLATTAMGRALLAALPAKSRPPLLRASARNDTKGWPRIRSGIDRALKETEKRGFTMSVCEWQSDINAVGVPLALPDGSGLFAFNCGAPAVHFSRERLEEEIGPRLLNAARNVEAELARR